MKAHAEQIVYTGCAKLVAEMGGLSADHLERLDEFAAVCMSCSDTAFHSHGVLKTGERGFRAF